MKNFIQYIQEGNAHGVTTLLEKTLQKKVMTALKDERRVVAEQTYGVTEESKDDSEQK